MVCSRSRRGIRWVRKAKKGLQVWGRIMVRIVLAAVV